LKEKQTARIVKRVFTRRYPHRKETYTYDRYYLELPGEYHDQLPPNFVKNYKITDVKVHTETGRLEVVCTPRNNALTQKSNHQT
jgi:hypothetical protein